jgi:hypothetical protein
MLAARDLKALAIGFAALLATAALSVGLATLDVRAKGPAPPTEVPIQADPAPTPSSR